MKNTRLVGIVVGLVVLGSFLIGWSAQAGNLVSPPKLDPVRGEPGIEVKLTAPDGDTYPISADAYWDGAKLDTSWEDETTLNINVPEDAKPGRHGIVVKYSGLSSEEVVFTVTDPSAGGGGGLPNSCDNGTTPLNNGVCCGKGMHPNADKDACDYDAAGTASPSPSSSPSATNGSGMFTSLKDFPGVDLGFKDILNIINNFTCWVLSVIVWIMIIFLVYSGWLFMSAGGNPSKAQAAVKNIRYVLIGILVIFAVGIIISSVAHLAGAASIAPLKCVL